MTNLTPILVKAQGRGSWGLIAFEALLERLMLALSSAGGWHWDWDSGVPENWATLVSKDSSSAAMLWCGGHFAFVRGDESAELVTALETETILSMKIDDWNEEVLSLDRAAVPELFAGDYFHHDEVDVSQMSVLDLYWATVS